LAYKNLSYQTVNLLPGLHEFTTSKFSNSPELPILIHNENIIQNSSDIINYLDTTFADNSLTPQDSQSKEQAIEWENFADQEIGPPLRCFFYHSLLNYPSEIVPLLSQQGAWYGKIFLRIAYKKLNTEMRRSMKIDASTAQKSKNQIDKAILKINAHLQHHTFLAGNDFSRADLAVAALLAPISMPEKYPVSWPKKFPEEISSTLSQWSKQLEWVNNLYREYR
jgi:glutathione S-transferase